MAQRPGGWINRTGSDREMAWGDMLQKSRLAGDRNDTIRNVTGTEETVEQTIGSRQLMIWYGHVCRWMTHVRLPKVFRKWRPSRSRRKMTTHEGQEGERVVGRSSLKQKGMAIPFGGRKALKNFSTRYCIALNRYST